MLYERKYWLQKVVLVSDPVARLFSARGGKNWQRAVEWQDPQG